MTGHEVADGYALTLTRAYAALCNMVGPSVSTTTTVIRQIYGPDAAERAGDALERIPKVVFRSNRTRCQEPWIALQKEALLVIGALGITGYEQICSTTVSKMEEGAVRAADAETLDHHKSGPVTVASGTHDIVSYSPDGIMHARRYLSEVGVL